jgi:hypothetical protein
VRNVPCLKCDQCGEVAYIGTVVKQLEKIINSMKTVLTEVAIVNYSDNTVFMLFIIFSSCFTTVPI